MFPRERSKWEPTILSYTDLSIKGYHYIVKGIYYSHWVTWIWRSYYTNTTWWRKEHSQTSQSLQSVSVSVMPGMYGLPILFGSLGSESTRRDCPLRSVYDHVEQRPLWVLQDKLRWPSTEFVDVEHRGSETGRTERETVGVGHRNVAII